MDYLDELRRAINRFITHEGATAAEIADSFCDLEGFTPNNAKLNTGLDRLVAAGKLRRDGDRYYDLEDIG